MGSHPCEYGLPYMKTTIEIADDLFGRAQRRARKERTTFHALTDQGSRMELKKKQSKAAKWKWKPVTFKGAGVTDEFRNAPWEEIRDEIYKAMGREKV